MSEKEEGRITIARVFCSDRDDFIAIEIDDKGHNRLADVELSLEGFTKAITGMGSMKCLQRTFKGTDGLVEALEEIADDGLIHGFQWAIARANEAITKHKERKVR